MLFLSRQKFLNILFALCLICSCVFNFLPNREIKQTFGPLVLNKTIIIDAGHGTPDGGAVGDGGSIEKDLNLKISLILGSYLEKCGANVLYTRVDDNSLANTDSKSIRQIKIDDLNIRKEFIEKSDADIFVSIHMNKFPDKKYSGAQVFYSSEHSGGEDLANSIQESIKLLADPDNDRHIKPVADSIFIFKNLELPSVLVECGFLSNSQEEQRLMTPQYQDKIAYAIFVGIYNYFTNLN